MHLNWGHKGPYMTTWRTGIFVYRIAEHSTYGRVTSVVILAGNISIAMVAMQAGDLHEGSIRVPFKARM